ncbi:hypothetical protein PS861_01477 [Pseudomonas fluorescens]|nr:hypothetical protein PS861_01477 [Pseudomonas fluorescens]
MRQVPTLPQQRSSQTDIMHIGNFEDGNPAL